ncbi:MAG: transglutaminase domain-containing protein [Deltaproteobacteria bacterium]|nr:MAG: transglutaminase domain-containing protein [Deltaproteobacteria bacterium]
MGIQGGDSYASDRAEADGPALSLRSEANRLGGAAALCRVTHTQDIEVGERLGDATAAAQLARDAKIGDKISGVHFDPSTQRVERVEHRVISTQRRNFAGVDTKAIKVQSSYPDLGVNETVWLDNAGKVLESQIGGFFVARLEPPEVAKRLDYTQDLLISNVVRAPRVLIAPQNLTKLTLTFQGFGEVDPPTSPRQSIKREGEQVRISLRKDPLPKRTTLSAARASLEKLSAAEIVESLQPTAFIQSDAPDLIKAAQEAVGDVQDVFAASTKLVNFVCKHIHSEYVPAYSNALEAYQSARGDCTEHSVLYVALARAIGIPSRVAVGIAYWPPGDGFGWHAWAESYIAGRWLAIDPTWNQPIADATHVKLADGGPREQARIVTLLGKLKITEMKN